MHKHVVAETDKLTGQLENVSNKLLQLKETLRKDVLSTVSKRQVLTKKDDMLRLLPMTHELSTSVVINNDICLGDGTFGIVTLGHFQTLDVPCAIKSGKNMHHSNPYFEDRVLQRLSGYSYFPYVSGVLASKSLVMELLAKKKDEVPDLFGKV